MVCTTKKKFAAILVDDDFLIRMSWKSCAQAKGLDFISFGSYEDFKAQLKDLDPQSPIYLDANLGGGIRGERVAEEIFKLGFHTIYLSTGYNPRSIQPTPELKAIVGKDPPF